MSIDSARGRSGRLANKIALVSGAGASEGGMSNGRASAVLMAREGARVFAADRNLKSAEETRDQIVSEGGECTAFECDVSDRIQVERMVAACRQAYGRIDILFNNVGIQAVGGALELAEEDWDRLMLVNVKSMYLTCRAVLPIMIEQGGGSIVNNASTAAIRFVYPSIGYSASKSAVRQLTQNIGVQYASKGVRCNSIMPGFIETPRILARLIASNPDDYEDKINERKMMVPNGRLGTPWDVANAVVFLASDESSYITATDLLIDGGLCASIVGRAID